MSVFCSKIMLDETMEDNHIFGESDYLNGNDYAVGNRVTAKVVDFLGRLEYVNRNGDKERAGYYKITNEKGNIKEFRLGQKNETILSKKFGFKSYSELIGATLVLSVKKYNLGNGFVIEEVKKSSPVATVKQPGQSGMIK